MKRLLIAALFIALGLAGATQDRANSIVWTVNATLDDGATVTGSFVFDPDLGSNQAITNFNISISAATPGTLTEPGDDGLPTSVFFPFNFTPTNSTGFGPVSFNDGALEFSSDAIFPNPIVGNPPEPLQIRFLPSSPLTDSSSTTINNGNMNLNDPYNLECFDCDPYVCYTGATSSLCVPAASTPEPPSFALIMTALALTVGALVLGRAKAIAGLLP